MIRICDHYLTPAECDRVLLEATHASLVRPGTIGAQIGLVEPMLYSATEHFAPLEWLLPWLRDLVAPFPIIEAPRILRYDVNDLFEWHHDRDPRALPLRAVTVILPLSDPVDYDGGELTVRGCPVDIPRARGSLIAFPAALLHRVSPITRGVRWSLVAWGADG
jgi:hypothetical protein